MSSDMFPEEGIASAASAAGTVASLADARNAAERREIERALDATDGQLSAAAKLPSVSRTTL